LPAGGGFHAWVTETLATRKDYPMQFASHVKWRPEKFGAVVFDTLNEKIFVTNATGRDILRLLAQGLDEAALTAHLQKDFTGEAARIEEEVREFLGTMRSARFLLPNTAETP
jgi:hypothetical protein